MVLPIFQLALDVSTNNVCLNAYFVCSLYPKFLNIDNISRTKYCSILNRIAIATVENQTVFTQILCFPALIKPTREK